MHRFGLVFAGMLSIGLFGCVAAPDGGDEPVAEHADAIMGPAADVSTYYIVTHLDARKCAWPTCGGYFVKRVNHASTQCADGVYRSECHVTQLDLGALALDDADASKFDLTYGEGYGLVRGDLVQAKSDVGPLVDTLVASEAWVAQTITAPTDNFYRVTSTGVECFVAPCPSYAEDKLNTGASQLLGGVDLAASGANEKQVGAGYAELDASGILVAGTHHRVKGPGGSLKALDASEFYLRLKPSAPPPEGQVCGGIAGLRCPDGQVCDVDVQGACGGYDLGGTCKNVAESCGEQSDPVCGCDGVTYSNDCFRVAAGAQIDHPGACDAGVKCGVNTCGEGQYCCNAGCGMCARTGMMCMQITCN